MQRLVVERDLEKLHGRMNQGEAQLAAKKAAEQEAEQNLEHSQELANFTRCINEVVSNMNCQTNSDAVAVMAAQDEKEWRGKCIMLERFLIGKTTSGDGVCTRTCT